ncbi:hypothetical protein ACF073_34780 [Streptomyces sp. NPDC015171]|uniref:hypothetical protein n=1 Tax=Streptomyces sp. NPDC015171 TaxID=3364945 RepID=UPI0036F96EB8
MAEGAPHGVCGRGGRAPLPPAGRGRAAELAAEILGLALASDSPSRPSWRRYSAAGAFLAAGEPDAALGLLGSLPADMVPEFLADMVPEFLSSVVEGLATQGDLERATRIAAETDDPAMAGRGLGFIAAGTAAAGDDARAVELLDAIIRPAVRDRAVPELVAELCRAGARAPAGALACTVTDPLNRSRALAAAVRSLGAVPEGRGLLAQALSLGPWAPGTS